MNRLEIFSLALEALKKNRTRTILSVVGIVIGISTLMLVLGISNAAESIIHNQLASFGADTIYAEVKIPNTDYFASGAAIGAGVQVKTMKVADVIGARKIPNVKNSYGAAFAQEKVVYRDSAERYFIMGTTQSYMEIDTAKIETGRFFTDAEDAGLAKVAVIGQTVKEELFGPENPVGKVVRIKGINFKVIGVMERRGAAFFQNYDEYVYLPLRTQQKLLLGYDYLPYFVMQVEDGAAQDVTAEDVRRYLRRQHGIQGSDRNKDDFEVSTSEDTMEQISVVFGAVSLLFGAIASISLIVGGVGIMNIMYVSVTERIREIGLRKAVGARRRDILLQFLLESVVITLLGGILGILFGLLLSSLAGLGAKSAGIDAELQASPVSLLIGLAVTIAFGIVFGYGPARKAAGLQPIEALRKE